MEKYVKTLVAVLIAALGLSLAACSSDDDGDGDFDIRLLATTWESVDGEFVLVFGSNYTGYYYEADYPGDKDYFTWQNSGKKIKVEYTSDYETAVWQIEKLTQNKLVMRNEEGEKMTFVTDSPVVLPDENASKVIGHWTCYEDAYGDLWDEPLIIHFDSDGNGYLWFQDEPFSYREIFSYTVSKSKIRFKSEDGNYDLRYEVSKNGKELVLYGYDDDDMSELHFER